MELSERRSLADGPNKKTGKEGQTRKCKGGFKEGEKNGKFMSKGKREQEKKGKMEGGVKKKADSTEGRERSPEREGKLTRL